MSKNTWTQWAPEWEQPGGHVHVRAGPAQADSGCPLPGGRDRGCDRCDQPGQWGAVQGTRETHDRPRGGRGRGRQVPHRGGQAAGRGGHAAQEWSARQLWQVRVSRADVTMVVLMRALDVQFCTVFFSSLKNWRVTTWEHHVEISCFWLIR